jgi:hypothetical protein
MCHSRAVSGFDPELYLRIVGEEMVLAADRGGGNPRETRPITLAAEALLVMDAIEPERARRILDEYLAAQGLRTPHGRIAVAHHRGRNPSPQALPETRTIVIGRSFRQTAGMLTIRDVTLGPEQTELGFTFVTDPGSAPTRTRRRMRPGPHPHPSTTVADDAGTVVTNWNFSGGSSHDRWDGELSARPGLSPSTRWLEIEGERVELPEPASPPPIAIEPVPGEDRAQRYLHGRLGAVDGPWGGAVEIAAATDALNATGADPQDPVFAEAIRIAEALPRHPGMAAAAAGPAGSALPQPWASLLARRGATDGPALALAVSAKTPEFDATIVAFTVLQSDPDGFDVAFQITPSRIGDGTGPLEWIAWWARDDLGNHYLGSPTGWNSGDETASGRLGFWPALDPAARRLDLMPTRPEHRAVISIDLPRAEQPS